jgi:hypothetical protein
LTNPAFAGNGILIRAEGKALALVVKNQDTSQRQTYLKELIQSA